MEVNVNGKAVKGSYVRVPLDSMKNDASGPPASPAT
jgi:hypothetical protein